MDCFPKQDKYKCAIINELSKNRKSEMKRWLLPIFVIGAVIAAGFLINNNKSSDQTETSATKN
jgi:hypothetical protein